MTTTLTPPNGFTPRALTSWNRYFIPQADANAYRVGDAVKSAGGTDAAGILAVTLHLGTGPARGVIVAVDPGLPATGGLSNGQKMAVPATKLTDFYVWVDDDPSHQFAMVDDGLTPANSVASSAGKFANFTPGVTPAVNGGSSAAIASSTLGSTSGCLQVISLQPGSSYGAASTWLVKFAAHELANGGSGGTGIARIDAAPDYTENVVTPVAAAASSAASASSSAAAAQATANSALKAPTNWAAGTNTPTLTSGTAVLGSAYKNTTAGNTSLGTAIDGITQVAQGDILICFTAGAYTLLPAGGVYLGAYGSTGALPTASANAGNSALVGTTLYFCNGTAWIASGSASPTATAFATIWDTAASKDMGESTISAALALTSTDVSSVLGGYTSAVLIADGTHIPTFDGATISNWNNTNGARNRVELRRTGGSKFWTVGANAGTAIQTPVPAAITSAPVLDPINTAAAVTWTPGAVTGVPAPSVTYSLKKNGTVVSSPATSGSYSSITAGDIFIVTQAATNVAYGGGTATPVDSAPVTATTGVAIGGLKTFTANNATAIDPQVKTGGNTIGASGSGWVVTVILRGLTNTGGTCVPTALTLNVSDPGYDTSGNPTTVTRTLTGVAQVRRQYPNGASKMISTDGTDLTLLVTLDDWIYAGTTITSVNIGSSFYTGCVAGSSGATVTNSSTIPYTKPLFSWLNTQNDYSPGSTYAVEGVAFHRHARAGQQVAAIQYSVTDGTTTVSPALVSTPTLSTKLTKGFGSNTEVWAASLNLSTLATAQIVTASAKVYPWIGDSTAILDLAVTGAAWPTTLPQTKLRIFNDRTGTYGGAIAYVLVGASGGTVSKTDATAKAAPFPTIVAAMNAIKTFNNANAISHNDHAGATIFLMDASGSAATHDVSTTPTADTTAGATFYTIRDDAAAVGALSVTWSAQVPFPSLVKYAGRVTHKSVAGQTYWFIGPNTANSQIWLDGITIDGTAGTASCMTWYSQKVITNVSMAGGRQLSMMNLADVTAACVLLAGCDAVGATCPDRSFNNFHTCVGNNLPYFRSNNDSSTTNGGGEGTIVYNNRLLGATFYNAAATTLNNIAIVQNLYEHTTAIDGSNNCMSVFNDGDLTTVTNCIEQHNTAVGNRCNHFYNDVQAAQVAPNGLQKIGSAKYNIWDDYNNKTDTFNADGAGATGNWAFHYSVGNTGNVSLFGEVNRVATAGPHNDNFTSPYMGSAWLPSSEYNLFRTALGYTQAQIMAMVSSYTTAPQGSPAIGGNYQPLSTASNLKGRVPAGLGVLKRDIAGNVRRTDGTGAAGCYESL